MKRLARGIRRILSGWRFLVPIAVVLTATLALLWILAYVTPLPARLAEPPSTVVAFADGSPAYVFLSPDDKYRMAVDPESLRSDASGPGTIDPDYRGELRVIMQNLGTEVVTLERGERIAQLVFARFESPEVLEVERLSDTERGVAGFGSTGTA